MRVSNRVRVRIRVLRVKGIQNNKAQARPKITKDKTRQDKARQDKTKTRHDTTRPDKTKRDKTRPDKTRDKTNTRQDNYNYRTRKLKLQDKTKQLQGTRRW
jgi:hypothetical protein